MYDLNLCLISLESSRRDDLEAICYVLIYLGTGDLPWVGTKGVTRMEKYAFIMEKKMECSEHMLCKHLPPQFADILFYVKGLEFSEKPNYQFIRDKLLDITKKKKLPKKLPMDWNRPVPPVQTIV